MRVLTSFIEKPLQNWTRENASLIGTAMPYLDYRAPIPRLREKLIDVLQREHPEKSEGASRVASHAVCDEVDLVSAHSRESGNPAGPNKLAPPRWVRGDERKLITPIASCFRADERSVIRHVIAASRSSSGHARG
ncbi:hypothetical protein MXD81_51510 [Microbacteriaceae bacterium K1510]|nr:hypothetical protein [Microbacteriaceae bacterium K1510]